MGTLRLEVLEGDDALSGIATRWDDLFDRSAFATPYLSRAWAEPWWRAFGGRSGVGAVAGRSRLHLAAIWEGSELVALAPWLTFRMGLGPLSVRVLVGVGQENADYGGVLLGQEPERTAPILLEHLAGLLGDRRTVVDLTRLSPDDPWLTALRERFRNSPHDLVSLQDEDYPSLDLASMDDPLRVVARLLKRNDVRRRWRRLDEQGGATFAYHRSDSVAADLETFFALHDLRWATKDHAPAGLFDRPTGRAFLGQASAALEQAGLLRLSTVWVDGRPVAARFGIEHRGTYHGIKSGWDPEFATFGPGHLVVGRILEHAAEAGLSTFDFMRGAGEHKAAWTDRERLVSYWLLGPADRFARVRQRIMWASLSLRSRRRDGALRVRGRQL